MLCKEEKVRSRFGLDRGEEPCCAWGVLPEGRGTLSRPGRRVGKGKQIGSVEGEERWGNGERGMEMTSRMVDARRYGSASLP